MNGRMIELSNRQLSAALNGQRIAIAWPTWFLGEYGSHQFDGSPTTPDGEQAAMERFAREYVQLPDGFGIESVSAGRRVGGMPVLCLRVSTPLNKDADASFGDPRYADEAPHKPECETIATATVARIAAGIESSRELADTLNVLGGNGRLCCPRCHDRVARASVAHRLALPADLSGRSPRLVLATEADCAGDQD